MKRRTNACDHQNNQNNPVPACIQRKLTHHKRKAYMTVAQKGMCTQVVVLVEPPTLNAKKCTDIKNPNLLSEMVSKMMSDKHAF